MIHDIHQTIDQAVDRAVDQAVDRGIDQVVGQTINPVGARSQDTLFRINEIFYSIEGEGERVGEATIFVRFAGCNLQCPWCDTSYHPTIRHRYTASDLLAHIRVEGWKGRWICLTGGEPMMQDSAALCTALREAGYRVHLETNGTYPIPPEIFNYVTISPKMQADVPHDRWPFLPENEAVADEFKYVITTVEDLETVRWGQKVYLQPNSSVQEAREICIRAVLNHPEWRLSAQVHRLLQIQ